MADEMYAADEAEDKDEASTPASKDKPVGPYQMDDEALVKCINDWRKESADATREQRKWRLQDWKMYAGDQWEEGDKERMQAGKRPALTLNMILGIVAAVEGEERSNRQEIKVFGESAEDDPAAQGMNLIFKWIDDVGNGQFHLSRQFKHGIVCGEGWIAPQFDRLDDPEGLIKLEWVDEDEMFDDPLSTCPVSSDSRRTQRAKMISEQEGEARWPGFREKVRQKAFENGIPAETDGSGYRDIYSTPDDTKSPKIFDAKKKLWSVLETWWYQIEPGWVMVDEKTNLLVELTDKEFEEAKETRKQEQLEHLRAVMSGEPMDAMFQPKMPQPLQAVQRPIKRMYQAFSAYDVLLAKNPSPLKKLKRSPYVPFRCIWDKVQKDWFGIVRSIVDPQRQHNVEQSVIIQLMQLMPKASWMGPKGSFHNKAEWQTKIAMPGAMLEYNGTRGKPEPIPVPAIPRHLIDMAFSRPEAMRAISGVNVELTGQRQGSDAGVVMEQRRKAATTVLAPIFDNYRWTKKVVGKVLISVIQTYITEGRRFRIMGPEGGAMYAKASKDMLDGDYDAAIDETNSTVNDRIATMNLLQTTLPQMVKAGLPMIPEFVDLMPMAPHIRDAWKRQLAWDMGLAGKTPPKDWKPGDPMPEQGPDPAVAAETMKVQAQIEGDKAKLAADQQNQQQQAALDAKLAQDELRNQVQQAAMQAQIDKDIAEMQAHLKQQTAIAEAEIKAETAKIIAGIQAKAQVAAVKAAPKPKPAAKKSTPA